MFLPLRDRLPTGTFPFINYLIIIANILAFFWQNALTEAGYASVVPEYGLVPSHLWASPITEAPTILTSMFMHGGWLHLGGNMLALWIFGDNVEDAIGHFRYVAFYLLGGIAAALTQFAVGPHSNVPMIGASGAIAAVMAAYLSLYPTSPITVTSPIPLFWIFFGFIFEVPAWVVAGQFFIFNLWSGNQALMMGSRALESGGTAFFAHVGGFVAGLVLVRIFMAGRTKVQADRWGGWRPPPKRRISEWDEPRYYR
jgi:membrane associated rhomboid family serine protease